MSDPFEDPNFRSAFNKFSTENGGEFNLRHLPSADDEAGWDKFAAQYFLSFIQKLACQS
jgi:hypothetical protein